MLVEGSSSRLGGALGLALAAAIVRLVEATEPGLLPRLPGAQLSWASVIASSTSLLAGLIVGVVPALRAGAVRPQGVNAPRGMALGRHRAAGLLVSAQLALCVLLLLAATMTGWGVARRVLVDPGFDPARVVILTIQPDRRVAGSGGRVHASLLDRVRRAQGSVDAAITDHLAPADAGLSAAIAVEGRPIATSDGPTARIIGVSGGYFDAMRIPVVAGRPISDDDVARDAPVALVNASLAGADDLVGRRLVMLGRVYDIVGVAGDVRQAAVGTAPEPTVYRPVASGAFGGGRVTFLAEMFLVARTAGAPEAMVPMLRALAAAPPERASITGASTLERRLWVSLSRPRFEAALFTLFAALGMVVAGAGLYGVVSFMVQAGAAEIGIRLVLGASPRAVVNLVVRQGLGVALAGLVAGLAMAPAAAGVVKANLEGAADAGPGVVLAVAVVLLGVVIAACGVPARRAARLDPVGTLRRECQEHSDALPAVRRHRRRHCRAVSHARHRDGVRGLDRETRPDGVEPPARARRGGPAGR